MNYKRPAVGDEIVWKNSPMGKPISGTVESTCYPLGDKNNHHIGCKVSFGDFSENFIYNYFRNQLAKQWKRTKANRWELTLIK